MPVNNSINVQRKLKQYGLSDNQVSIYLLLVRSGDKRISDISTMTAIPRSSVYESLKGLFAIGLVEEIVQGSYKQLQAYPFGSIEHTLNERISELRRLSAVVPQVESELNALPALSPTPTATIRYYNGISGARQIFWNSLKTRNMVYVYSEWGRSRYLGRKFYESFVTESKRRGLKEKVLTNPLTRVLASIKSDYGTTLARTKLHDIHFIDKRRAAFKGETLIYDNTYAQVYLKDGRISGFEIESSQFVQTQRAIFELLWNMAESPYKLLEIKL
jgi:sugar-specific transcriptional regulator TrmB